MTPAAPEHELPGVRKPKEEDFEMRKLKYGLLGTAAVLALAVAVPAVSQAGPGKGGHGARLFEQTDTNGDGYVSKDEMQAASEKRFAGADADGDGVLTKDEMAAVHGKMRTGGNHRRGDPAERFAAADADGDGKLTLDEMKAAAAARMAEHGKDGDMSGRHADRMEKFFAAADKDGDGALTQDEMQGARENMKTRMGNHEGKHGDRGGRFGRIDTDGDGQVTKAEFAVGSEKMFERLDANGDGKIEPGEGRMHRGGPGARAPEAE